MTNKNDPSNQHEPLERKDSGPDATLNEVDSSKLDLHGFVPTLAEDLSEPLTEAQTSSAKDQPMDSPKVAPDKPDKTSSSGTGEMDIDLGYAEYTDAYSEAETPSETDDIEDLDDIDTPILTERVEDDLHYENIAKLEAIVFGGEQPVFDKEQTEEPAQQNPPEAHEPLKESAPAPAAEHTTAPETPAEVKPAAPTATAAPNLQLHPSAPLTAKGENPFLPKHILDRLNQGRNLVEEIAQSSAALDASTAILRTHARAERMNKPVYGESQRHNYGSSNSNKSDRQRQALIDDLVDEYLPLIAAELRRRLNRMVDD